MITLLTGSPGHGKSYTLIREIERAVSKGKPVATNVPLHEDWARIMARRHTLFGRWRKDAVQAKADVFSSRVLVSDKFDEILRVRLSGKGEGRGLLILDESQRWLNARGWDNALNDDGTAMKRSEALAARLKVVNHLSGHRHYGFDVILATQSDKSIDNQARELYEFHSEVRNMRKLPWLGAIVRWNMFLRVTRWNDRARSKAGVDLYFLSKSLARLYHTHALQEKDWPEDAIILPRSNEPEPEGAELFEPECLGIPFGLGLEAEPARPPLPDPEDIRSSYAR
jgi:zona occludens toxin